MSATAAGIRAGRPRLISVPRPLGLIHRWLGIGVGLMFALWFASGAILTFVPFPALRAGQRIAGSASIDFARVRISPRAALASVAQLPVERLRLISVAGQPRYVLSIAGQPVLSISAQSGRRLGLLAPEAAAREAASFGGGRVAALRGPFNYDQWTVHDQYDRLRPFYAAHMEGGRGTELYVSARSGQVVQRTRRDQRAWNWPGAVLHWVNIVALRRHQTLYRWVVLTLGLACTALALLGIVLGVVHLINARRARRKGLSAFRGWLRWHHVSGLFAGVLLLAWIVSGCLMLDGGTIFPSAAPTAGERAAVRGMTLQAAAARFPLALLQSLPPARQVEITAVDGEAFLVFWDAAGRSHLATASLQGGLSLTAEVPPSVLAAAVRTAWPGVPIQTVRSVGVNDPYRLLSSPLPATTVRVILADAGRTWVEMDSATGRVVSVTDTRSRARQRWVIGLHELDFPWLDRAGPLRLILIALGSAAGFAFSLTGIVLAAKRLRSAYSRQRSSAGPRARFSGSSQGS
jgi:hypothetical protein